MSFHLEQHKKISSKKILRQFTAGVVDLLTTSDFVAGVPEKSPYYSLVCEK
jgi:hypothetical protein